MINIDGKGPHSSPLNLKVIEILSSSLKEDTLREVRQRTRLDHSFPFHQKTDANHQDAIAILDPETFLSIDLEKWIMKYTSDERLDNIHSISFLFGVAYAKEKLPHVSLAASFER